MVKIYPPRGPQQHQAPGRLSSRRSSSISSSSSGNRSPGSVSTQATTTSSNSLINYQQKASPNVTSVSNKQQRNSIGRQQGGRQQGKVAAPSSRCQQAQKTSSPQKPRDARHSASSKSNHSTEDVKPGPSNDAASFVAIATGPSDERLNLFNNFRAECEYFTNTAERKIEELRDQNKDLEAQISELKRKLDTSENHRDTISENLKGQTQRSDRLEQELDLCKKEKQSVLDQQSQSQKKLKELEAQLDEAQKRNNDLQNEAKLHEDKIREISEQLNDETNTNTQLHNKVSEMTRACESSEVENRDLREQLKAANEEKAELDTKVTSAREASEVEKQDLQGQLNTAKIKNAELRGKANAMRKERDEAVTAQQSAIGAETENKHLQFELGLLDEKIIKLENDMATKQTQYNKNEQRWEVDLTDYLSMIQYRDDSMFENEYNQAQEHTDNIEAEISTLKSDNETLSKEKQDLTARNTFIQRSVRRVSARLRTTQRLLTIERANSMRFRKQRKALCTALDEAKEEQTKLTIANRDLETLIPTLRKNIKDLKDWIIALELALLDAERQPSTSQDSSRATARPNDPRTRERKRNRQLGQIREGGRTHIGEWWSQTEMNRLYLRAMAEDRRKNGRKGRSRR